MTLRVLIVGTVLHKAKILQKSLTGAGFNVVIATNQGDGLTLCRQGRADVVIFEGQQPDFDGFRFCRTLKDDQALRHLSVGLITDESEPWQRFKALEAEADECLPFPIAEIPFLTRMRSLADLWTMGEGLRRAMTIGGVTGPLVETRPARVLLLDPDPHSRLRLEEILSQEFGVVTACQAEDAVACMIQEPFGIVLSDFNEVRRLGPVGALLIKQLHLAGLTECIRVIGIGGNLDETVGNAPHGVLDDILMRPIDRNEALARVRIAARKHAIGMALKRVTAKVEILARQPRQPESGPPDRMAA
jgi:two-component system cell cycle response regulator